MALCCDVCESASNLDPTPIELQIVEAEAELSILGRIRSASKRDPLFFLENCLSATRYSGFARGRSWTPIHNRCADHLRLVASWLLLRGVAIRIRLQVQAYARPRNVQLGDRQQLRGCDVVSLRVEDVAPHGQVDLSGLQAVRRKAGKLLHGAPDLVRAPQRLTCDTVSTGRMGWLLKQMGRARIGLRKAAISKSTSANVLC